MRKAADWRDSAFGTVALKEVADHAERPQFIGCSETTHTSAGNCSNADQRLPPNLISDRLEKMKIKVNESNSMGIRIGTHRNSKIHTTYEMTDTAMR